MNVNLKPWTKDNGWIFKGNSGHIIKVSTNFSEKKLLALTTHSSVLLFGINGSHGCDTTALQFNQQIPYEVLFINDNSIVIISSNLKNHFICYDMVKNRQIYEKTTGDLGFVETEWIAYLTAIVPNQLWFSTNKGRIFMLQLDQSQVFVDITSRPIRNIIFLGSRIFKNLSLQQFGTVENKRCEDRTFSGSTTTGKWRKEIETCDFGWTYRRKFV